MEMDYRGAGVNGGREAGRLLFRSEKGEYADSQGLAFARLKR